VLAAVPAGASAAGTDALYVQNASSGTYDGTHLTLRGVAPVVTWFADRPERDAGVLPTRRAMTMLFDGQANPNAALDFAGSQLTGVVPLELSDPRYDPKAQTMRFRARKLKDLLGGDLSHRNDQVRKAKVPQRFGKVSLFIDDVDAVFNQSCQTTLVNSTSYELNAGGFSKWDTDSWDKSPSSDAVVGHNGGSITWSSAGGSFRGCSNAWTFTVLDGLTPTQVNVSITDPYKGDNSSTCTVGPPANFQYRCTRTKADSGTYDYIVSYTLSDS
jgi:hypothetical protein